MHGCRLGIIFRMRSSICLVILFPALDMERYILLEGGLWDIVFDCDRSNGKEMIIKICWNPGQGNPELTKPQRNLVDLLGDFLAVS